jgi:hypothetical protein
MVSPEMQVPHLAGDWIMANIGAHTLCRVQYDNDTFNNIIEQLVRDHEVSLERAHNERREHTELLHVPFR